MAIISEPERNQLYNKVRHLLGAPLRSVELEDEQMDTTETLKAGESQGASQPVNKKRRRRTAEGSQSQSQKSSAPTSTGVIVSAEVMKQFKSALFKLFHKERAQALTMTQIFEHVKGDISSMDEVKAALNMMQDDNQIMISDDNVFII